MEDEKAADLVDAIADNIQGLNEDDRNIAEDIITKSLLIQIGRE